MHNVLLIYTVYYGFPCSEYRSPNTFPKLLGTYIDLSDYAVTVKELAKTRQKPITYEQGVKLVRKVRAFNYLECSAKMQKGLRNVFDEAIVAASESPPKIPPEDAKSCSLQ